METISKVKLDRPLGCLTTVIDDRLPNTCTARSGGRSRKRSPKVEQEKADA